MKNIPALLFISLLSISGCGEHSTSNSDSESGDVNITNKPDTQDPEDPTDPDDSSTLTLIKGPHQLRFISSIDPGDEAVVKLMRSGRQRALYSAKMHLSERGDWEAIIPTSFFLQQEYLFNLSFFAQVYAALDASQPSSESVQFSLAKVEVSNVCESNMPLGVPPVTATTPPSNRASGFFEQLIQTQNEDQKLVKAELIAKLQALPLQNLIETLAKKYSLKSISLGAGSVSHYVYPDDKIILSAAAGANLETLLHEFAHFLDYRLKPTTPFPYPRISDSPDYRDLATQEGLNSYDGTMDAACDQGCRKEVFADNLGRYLGSASTKFECQTAAYFSKLLTTD